jgi:hypothetical protein
MSRKPPKIIRIMTDIRVNSELFDFFSGIFGKEHFQKSPDFGVIEKSRKWPIFRRTPEN